MVGILDWPKSCVDNLCWQQNGRSGFKTWMLLTVQGIELKCHFITGIYEVCDILVEANTQISHRSS